MKECTLLILDQGLSPEEIAANTTCCKVGPGTVTTDEN